MPTLGARLEQHLEKAGVSQAELARVSGVKQQTISYIIRSGARSSAYATRLAQALGVNPYWLQDGTGDPFESTVAVGHEGATSERAHWVPKKTMDDLVSGQSVESKAVVTTMEVGPAAYAVDVRGRAMEPALVDGDELIVDPNIQPQPGDFVLAVVDGVAVLRKWRPVGRDGRFHLVALNPDYPLLECDKSDTAVAVVVEHRRRFRK